jgi:hypothetical protein
MNETETTELEQLLRNSVAGHRPAAPDALLEFIETVPTRERQTGPIGRILGGRLARRSVLGLAAAAAVIVALVGSAALMSSRKPSVPAAESLPTSDGWAWQATDGTLYFAEMQVPRGFIATCGHYSGQSMVDETPCSSPDGLHWSVPADPAIVSIEGDGPFLPIGFLVRDGTYLVVSSPLPGEGQGPATTLWRSTDGVHWSAVTRAPELAQTEFHLASVATDGFLAVGTRNVGGPLTEEMLISADGLTWSKVGDMPYDVAVVGGPGVSWTPRASSFYVTGPRPGGTEVGTWMTADGRRWQDVSLPAGYTQVQPVALPSGGYLGVGSSYDGAMPNMMISSTDGLAWELDPSAPAGSVDQLVLVGDRLVAVVNPTPYDGSNKVLQSLDWGRSWQPLLDLSGQPVSGTIRTLGGHLEIVGADTIVHWLLSPVKPDPAASPVESAAASVSAPPSESETPSATPEPIPTIAANPTPLPSSLTGEWTWRKTDGTHFSGAFAVPGGFVATCGHIAGNELADASLCSSPDGLTWTVPADPALIVVPDNGPFWPIHVMERNGVYLAFALSRPLPTVAEPTASLWRSTDGRHWSQVDSPALAGQPLMSAGLLADRFAAIVKSADGTAAAAWLSTDGSTWEKAGDLPTVPTRNGFDSQGLYVEGNEATGSQTGTWLTTDGRQWARVTLPAGATNILSSIRMSDGGFVGLGVDFVSGGNGTLMHSSDGLVWEADSTTPAGHLFSLSQVGDRLVVTISQPNNDGPYSVWQSSDRGQTWQPLPGPDGYQLTTMAGRLGDNLSSMTGDDAVVVAVGTLNGR